MNEATANEVMQFNSEKLLDQCLPYIRTGQLQYQSRQDLLCILEMLIVLLRRAIVKVFSDISQKDEAQRQFARQLDMLKTGILKQGGEA